MGLHPAARRGSILAGTRRRSASPLRPDTAATDGAPEGEAPSPPQAELVSPPRPIPPPQGAGAVLLLDHARTLRGASDVAATVNTLEGAARGASGAVHARAWLLDPTGTALQAPGTGEAVTDEDADGGGCPRDTVPVGSGVVGRCAATSRPVTARTTGSRRELLGAQRPGDGEDPTVVTLHHLALPLVCAGRLIGVLDVAWAPEEAPEGDGDERSAALEVLAALAAAQVEALTLRAAGTWAAERDPETGLLHGERLARDVAQECARSERYGQPFSVVALRVDDHGAWRGPESALSVAADLVHAHVRAADAVYRFDATAIAVLAPHTGPEGGAALGARLEAVLVRRFTPAPGDAAGSESSAQVRLVWAAFPGDADGSESLLDDVRSRLEGPLARD